MNARKLQTQSSAEIMERLVPALSEADGGHEAVDSPAALLQRRLDGTLAAASAAGQLPAVTPWPGAVRLILLAAGAAGSWMAVALAVRALI